MTEQGRKHVSSTAASSRRRAALAIVSVAVLCAAVSPTRAQSITDSFKEMFGLKPKPAPAPAPGAPASVPDDLTCPPVTIRAGASTFAVGLPGKEASGTDLRYQAVIRQTARECDYNTDTHVIATRIGVQGRVIVGPAGAPPTVEVPLRVAVVQDGVTPKTIATKAYTISVAVPSDDGAPFSFVADDISYPAPTGTDGDKYVFYVGFDPQALKPEPRRRAKRHRR